MSPPSAASPPTRVQIEDPQPLLDCGRYAVKACVGDRVEVSATIFADGHDVLAAVVRSRGPGEREWSEAPMHRSDAELGGDRWSGSFTRRRAGTLGVDARCVDRRRGELAG